MCQPMHGNMPINLIFLNKNNNKKNKKIVKKFTFIKLYCTCTFKNSGHYSSNFNFFKIPISLTGNYYIKISFKKK